ncbi:V-type ATP synthase subunit E [Pyrodictium delaneyi]|uniref:V-type ATP synthase subunit E n=1 Tax=Pyrodictium delaneyi TaxID=1273541 RepID=A0A0N7JD64_9CREN|nr:V-type ATP synthase subunit E [Pyrodictium delaneyi]ALL01321.1 V-type ATP synthase subunit E [Pyrodictium delaneyi]OWJ53869.1 hypothetical protein Pdsh_10155 [Pyrodictium delaneyi]
MAGPTTIRLLGDPEKLADEITRKVREDIEVKVNSALEAAKKIVERSYEENLAKLEDELKKSVRNAREQLESYSAKQEVELRKRLARIRAEAVEEILGQALQQLRSRVGEDDYVEFLAKRLEEAVSRASQQSSELIVVPAESDVGAVRKALKKVKTPSGVKVELADSTVEGIGGFVLRTRDGLSLDYRLEVILASAIEEARSKIIELLFRT